MRRDEGEMRGPRSDAHLAVLAALVAEGVLDAHLC